MNITLWAIKLIDDYGNHCFFLETDIMPHIWESKREAQLAANRLVLNTAHIDSATVTKLILKEIGIKKELEAENKKFKVENAELLAILTGKTGTTLRCIYCDRRIGCIYCTEDEEENEAK